MIKQIDLLAALRGATVDEVMSEAAAWDTVTLKVSYGSAL